MRGTAEAPPLIRAALFSDASNLWTENGTNLGAQSLVTDAGDLSPVPAAAMNRKIEEAITDLLVRDLKPIALGGDHSITYPVVKAVSRKHDSLTVFHFDAHPDLYDEFQGNRYSHACPFARIMEEKLVKRLVQVGIRTMTGHQREQAHRFGAEVVEMKDWQDVLPDCAPPVYISFDLDVLDPAFAPGIVHREPGGLSVRQAINAIQGLRANVVGADIVEFNPRLDPLHMTGGVCAKLLKEIAAKMLEQKSL
jgi:agmatinase